MVPGLRYFLQKIFLDGTSGHLFPAHIEEIGADAGRALQPAEIVRQAFCPFAVESSDRLRRIKGQVRVAPAVEGGIRSRQPFDIDRASDRREGGEQETQVDFKEKTELSNFSCLLGWACRSFLPSPFRRRGESINIAGTPYRLDPLVAGAVRAEFLAKLADMHVDTAVVR